MHACRCCASLGANFENYSQGSVATFLRVMGTLMTVLLQIICRVSWWKNFENRSISGEDADKSCVLFFFDSGGVLVLAYYENIRHVSCGLIGRAPILFIRHQCMATDITHIRQSAYPVVYRWLGHGEALNNWMSTVYCRWTSERPSYVVPVVVLDCEIIQNQSISQNTHSCCAHRPHCLSPASLTPPTVQRWPEFCLLGKE